MTSAEMLTPIRNIEVVYSIKLAVSLLMELYKHIFNVQCDGNVTGRVLAREESPHRSTLLLRAPLS
jgi:hypothetical protein